MSQHLSVYPFIHFALYINFIVLIFAKHCVQCLASRNHCRPNRYGLSLMEPDFLLGIL